LLPLAEWLLLFAERLLLLAERLLAVIQRLLRLDEAMLALVGRALLQKMSILRHNLGWWKWTFIDDWPKKKWRQCDYEVGKVQRSYLHSVLRKDLVPSKMAVPWTLQIAIGIIRL
jgi:hypothetical protein